jgi:hypothetical protein
VFFLHTLDETFVFNRMLKFRKIALLNQTENLIRFGKIRGMESAEKEWVKVWFDRDCTKKLFFIRVFQVEAFTLPSVQALP